MHSPSILHLQEAYILERKRTVITRNRHCDKTNTGTIETVRSQVLCEVGMEAQS